MQHRTRCCIATPREKSLAPHYAGAVRLTCDHVPYTRARYTFISVATCHSWFAAKPISIRTTFHPDTTESGKALVKIPSRSQVKFVFECRKQ